MVNPLPLIGLIMIGTKVYKVGKGMLPVAEKLVKKGIASWTKSTKKPAGNLTKNNAEKILSDKTPSTITKIGGRLRGERITQKTAGAEKSTITVGKSRTKARDLGETVVKGGAGIGIGVGGTKAAERVSRKGESFTSAANAKKEKARKGKVKKMPSTYTIKKGDTYSSIAEKTGVTVKRLRELNKTDPKKLQIGKSVRLSGSASLGKNKK